MSVKSITGKGVDIGINMANIIYTGISYPYDGVQSASGGPLDTLLGRLWFPMYNVDARWFFGLNGLATHKVETPGRKPRQLSYDYLTDFNRYSWPLGRALQVITGVPTDIQSQDNGVVHSRIDGHVRPKSDPLYTFSQATWSFLGRSFRRIDQFDTNAQRTQRFRLGNSSLPSNLGSTYVYHDLPFTVYDTAERLQEIWDDLWDHRLDGPSPYIPRTAGTTSAVGLNGQWMRDLRVTITDRKLVLQFQQLTCLGSQSWLRVMDVKLSITFTEGAKLPYSVRGTDAVDVVQVYETSARVFEYSPNAGSDAEFLNWRPFLAYPPLKRYSSRTAKLPTFMLSKVFGGEDTDVSVDGLDRRVNELVTHYEGRFLAELRDYRPSTNMALTDAIQSQRSIVSNWVETLSEVGDLLSLIPSLNDWAPDGAPRITSLADLWDSNYIRHSLNTGSVKSLGSAKVSYDGVDALRSIANAISAGYILYSFGWSPAATAVEDISLRITSVADRLEALLLEKKLHGTFVCPGSAREYFQSRYSSLVTRTTFDLTSLGDVCVKLLLADAYGLLPTTSRIWDTRQLSWFTDTIWNVGDRLDMLDSYVFAELLGAARFCHSFTAVISVPKSALADAGLYSPDGLTIRIYVREVSNFVPALFNARTMSWYIAEKRLTGALVFAFLAQFLLGALSTVSRFLRP